MATELNEKILHYLNTSNSVDTLDLASEFNEEHQKIIGCVKSLQSLGELITAEQRTHKTWELTDEGRHVADSGSHEVIVFNAVPKEGIPQSDLMKAVPNPKIGFSKAMSNGWISVNKSGGAPVIVRKVSSVNDVVREHLCHIRSSSAEKVPENLKQEYKKRKLLQEILTKSFLLRKGAAFTTCITKPETDLTPEMIATGSWRQKLFKPYNLNALGVSPECGHLHPLLKVRSQFRQIFLEMGFSEMPTSNFVESSFWNFDALFQPQQHPARDAHDTFFVSEPQLSTQFPHEYLQRVKKVHSEGGYGSQGYGYDWKLEEAQKNLLRTHTTAVSARMLYKLVDGKDFRPVKYFSIDRVFRNETLDATHLAEFHQVEGVVADFNLTLGDLIGILHEFFGKLGISQLHFKPAYNPYTEPSMEIFSYHTGLQKWVEVGNSGMFRPELLRPMGIPRNVTVIAWGLSLERPTMIKYKLNNIRDLVGPKVDLKMVHDSSLCRLDKDKTSLENILQNLELRWTSIHVELESLQVEVKTLQGDMGLCGLQHPQEPRRKKIDLVIFADPQYPPYSLLVLTNLFDGKYNIRCTTHVHSSVNSLNSKLPHLKSYLNGNSILRELVITLIWKSVGVDPVLVHSPLKNFQIVGEVNIGRYFCRLLEEKCTTPIVYENKGEVVSGQVDGWLDHIYNSLTHGENKERVNFLNELNCLSKHQDWLLGSVPSLADVCLWSALKQLYTEIPSQVKNMFDKYSAHPFFLIQ